MYLFIYSRFSPKETLYISTCTSWNLGAKEPKSNSLLAHEEAVSPYLNEAAIFTQIRRVNAGLKKEFVLSYFFNIPSSVLIQCRSVPFMSSLHGQSRTPRLNEAWRQYGFMQSVYKWYVSSYEFSFLPQCACQKSVSTGYIRLYAWNTHKHLVPGGAPKSPGAWGNQNCRFDDFWGDQKTTKGRVLEEVRDRAASNTVP